METREIKFRGKRLDTGEWACGDLGHRSKVTPDGLRPATTVGRYDVDPATVGQFTGLYDISGNKEVYEGDIVIINYHDEVYVGKVKYSIESMAFCVETATDGVLYAGDFDYVEKVIGNVHDDPELLKGGHDGQAEG